MVDAADWLRHDLDVSKPLSRQACLAMGREQAAIALAVVSTKDPAHFRTTPGGYFHGIVAKAKAGELNLDRTLWAMRRAAEPKPYGQAAARETAAAVRLSDRRPKRYLSTPVLRWGHRTVVPSERDRRWRQIRERAGSQTARSGRA